jgi:hypothetical protein
MLRTTLDRLDRSRPDARSGAPAPDQPWRHARPTERCASIAQTLGRLLLVSVVALSVSGCSLVSEEAAIRSLVDSQTQYLNSRNVDGYMSTIASDAPQRAITENTMRQLTSYDIHYEVEDLTVLNIQDGRGVIRVVQTTRIHGKPPTFLWITMQSNRSIMEHALVKESTGWKVRASTLVNSEPLS